MAVTVLDSGLYDESQSISVDVVNNSSPVCQPLVPGSRCYIGIFSYDIATGVITGEPIISNCTIVANSSKRNSVLFPCIITLTNSSYQSQQMIRSYFLLVGDDNNMHYYDNNSKEHSMELDLCQNSVRSVTIRVHYPHTCTRGKAIA